MGEKEVWNTIESEAWKPTDEGDQVIGTVVTKAEAKGELSARYHLLGDDGQRHLIWGTAILDQRLQFVNVGDRVRITYDGVGKNKQDRDMKLYTVEMSNGKPKEQAVEPDVTEEKIEGS